ncbi:MAG: hypothetical protein P4L31_07520 [Candidatus Babeliales bacterium]|nr:hypothetical protein [Candidatus Babeliales bacterium]
MKKIQEISDYRVLGYSEKDKDELSDRETAFSAKPKKLGFNDILKLGAKLTPFKIPDNGETYKMIEDVKKRQQEIKDTAKVDWNDPNLRIPMNI